jgi:hypothetical protein
MRLALSIGFAIVLLNIALVATLWWLAEEEQQ